MDDPQQDSQKNRKLSPLRTLASVLSAVVGIQSRRNRERDFERGKAPAFIIAALVVTLTIVLTLVLVVRLVLSQATP